MVPDPGPSLENLSDVDLVQRICDGCEDALLHLVVDRFGGLFKMISAKFHYDGDLPHEVCVRLWSDGDWSRLRSWKGSGLRSWLRTLATHICLNEYQRRKKYLGRFQCLTKVNDAPDQIESVSTELLFIQEVQRSKLLRAINKLSPREQNVINSHCLGDLTIEELSELLRLEVSAARTAKSRAIQRLRELLQREEGTDDV